MLVVPKYVAVLYSLIIVDQTYTVTTKFRRNLRFFKRRYYMDSDIFCFGPVDVCRY